MRHTPLRIGVGAGFAGDRIDPAVDLARRGQLDYLAFECLAERTLAYGHLQRRADPSKGFHTLLERRLENVLAPALHHHTVLVSNMGVANPLAAGQAAAVLARRLGLSLRIAVVTGDDVSEQVRPDSILTDTGSRVQSIGSEVVGANAYLGIDAILPALQAGADLIITGRVADPSLFLAPMVHHYGWSTQDWPRLGAGTLVGHLLECSLQITGGYFADPPYKSVPNIAQLGMPFARVQADGSATISKLAGTGGLVSDLTVKEQMMYEVHNPSAYITPDVSANFSQVQIRQSAQDEVQVSDASGRERPELLKAIVGFDGGWLAEAEFSYGGPGATERAQLALDIVLERMRTTHACTEQIRADLIGVNALHATALTRQATTQDVRLRVAMRSAHRALAQQLLAEVEGLWLAGPAGGGGYRGQLTPSVTTHTLMVERESIRLGMEIIQT